MVKITCKPNDKVICEGKTQTREDALKFYIRCMANSEGAEQERYTNAFLDLYYGETVVNAY